MKKSLLTLVAGCCCSGVFAQGLIDNYLNGTPTYTVVANASNQVSQPRDLDFKPLTNELWVINKGASNGGSVVIIYDADQGNPSILYRKDSHSGHFMIYPSALAFADNGEFANTNEIKSTAGPSSTFMGPALWSGDTAIFANVFQNNWQAPKPLGSHLDMLHQSPFSMGIAHDTASMYWVFDGWSGNLCKYDFGMHHSPGYDDHSNGEIWRYTDVSLTRQVNIPGHMVKDQSTGWLYIVDAGTKKLKRVNPATAINIGALPVATTGYEPLLGHWNMTGATVEVLDSFASSQPCGIEVYENRLLVGDFNTGDIHVYDISTVPVKIGTIATGQAGMMGLKVGSDGKIWFVNETQNTVVRIDPAMGLSNDVAIDAITAPEVIAFNAHFYNTGFNQCGPDITPEVRIRNTGNNVLTSATIQYTIDNGAPVSHSWTGNLAPGATATVTLPVSTVGHGAHELRVIAMNPNLAADPNMANNAKMGSFRTFDPVATYPFTEDFTNNTFPPSGWAYLAHNFNNEMSHAGVGASGAGSLRMNNYDHYEDISGQRDYLILPRIDMSNANSNAGMSFAVAYAQYNASSTDRISVQVSTDCGATWTQVYTKFGSGLSTTSPTTAAYTPAPGEWRTEQLSLSNYAGQQDVMIRFVLTSDHGNNLYIDDVNISNTAGIDETISGTFAVYPNPASHVVNIKVPANINADLTVDIHDMMGRKVKSVAFAEGTQVLTLETSDLTAGNYLINISSGEQIHQEKLSIVK